jgi:hypothetical protein
MPNSRTGRAGHCLCGGVAYQTDGPIAEVMQCHCENCRRLSGNFVAAGRAATDDLQIADPDGYLRWHELGYARYGFCRNCGSTLFYQGPTAGTSPQSWSAPSTTRPD